MEVIKTSLSDLANDDPLYHLICSVELSRVEKNPQKTGHVNALLMPWS